MCQTPEVRTDADDGSPLGVGPDAHRTAPAPGPKSAPIPPPCRPGSQRLGPTRPTPEPAHAPGSKHIPMPAQAPGSTPGPTLRTPGTRPLRRVHTGHVAKTGGHTHAGPDASGTRPQPGAHIGQAGPHDPGAEPTFASTHSPTPGQTLWPTFPSTPRRQRAHRAPCRDHSRHGDAKTDPGAHLRRRRGRRQPQRHCRRQGRHRPGRLNQAQVPRARAHQLCGVCWLLGSHASCQHAHLRVGASPAMAPTAPVVLRCGSLVA